MRNQNHRSAWKGLAAGIVGGIVASWAMDRFQYWWLSFGSDDERQLADSGRRKHQQRTGNGKDSFGDFRRSLRP